MIGAWSSWHYQGQTCITASRQIVMRAVADKYIEALARRARAIVVGDPATDAVGLGPMISEGQRDHAHRLVEASIAQGATPRRGRHLRRPVLSADGPAGRDTRHARLPRGDLRPGRPDHRRRHRGGGARPRQRHSVRPGQRRLHRRHRRAGWPLPRRSTRAWSTSTTPPRSTRRTCRSAASGMSGMWRPLRRRGQPRGVHGATLDQHPAHPRPLPVLIPAAGPAVASRARPASPAPPARVRNSTRTDRMIRRSTMPDERGNGTAQRPQHADVLIIGAGASGSVAAKRLGGGRIPGRLPRAGRLDRLRQGSRRQAGLRAPPGPRLELEPDHPAVAGRLPDRRVGIGYHRAHVQRRRWRQRHVRRPLAAKHAVRLPRPHPRRRGRRLAADLRGSPARSTSASRVDMGVSGLDGDTAFPPGPGWPLPPSPLGVAGKKVAAAHNELGWHWWPGPNAIATRATKHLKQCARRGTCLWGCIERAKGTVDLHPLARRPRGRRRAADPLPGCAASSSAPDGLVRAPSTSTATGGEHVQTADVTILAANGIGTPRLLLASATDRYPDGLANSSGLVGKRLMMHPFGTVVGLFDEDLKSWEGPWGQSIHCLEFYETDARRGFVRGAKWGLQPTGGPVSMTRTYPFGRQPDLGRGLPRERAQAPRPLGHVGHHRRGPARRAEPRRAPPGPEGRATACRPRRSSTGRTRTRERLVAFHQARAAESLEQAGCLRGRHRAVHPRDRLAPAGHGEDGRRPGHRSSTAAAASTTIPTCSSSMAAPSRRPRG